jgi:hypothetical protein
MRKFTYIIGSMDDFESYDALEAAYRNGTIGDYNASVFTFDVPDVGTDSLTVRDIATYIGRGLAFSSDWCMDGTFGDLLEA